MGVVVSGGCVGVQFARVMPPGSGARHWSGPDDQWGGTGRGVRAAPPLGKVLVRTKRMAKRPSLIRECQLRLDSLMAIGQSRHEAKERMRESGQSLWAATTGRIHSYGTREAYQQQVMQFAQWARENHGVRHLSDLEARSDELAEKYLQQQRDESGWRPTTLRTARSALRLFFGERGLAADVDVGTRHREEIVRSRQGSEADRRWHEKLEWHPYWREVVAAERAMGLRRAELERLRVEDVREEGGHMIVYVRQGKGGRERDVPVLPGREGAVRRLLEVEGRASDERVVTRPIPHDWDVHADRRAYAQELYRQLSGRELPPAEGRLPRDSYDRQAVMQVSQALGHSRTDVVLRHYLR